MIKESTAKVYYNEFDPWAAEWLRNLGNAGEIQKGMVDERSIAVVGADELLGYGRAHFFAGIGGWDEALNLAGWPAGIPVWSGSCPCQPFSSAGKRRGDKDERHLWPVFRSLIAECRPPVIFGEQVASKDGRIWFAGVRADLEALGYAVGGADLSSAGVGSPNIRQRLYWVARRLDYSVIDGAARAAIGGLADAEDPDGRGGECGAQAGIGENGKRWRRDRRHRSPDRMADPSSLRFDGSRAVTGGPASTDAGPEDTRKERRSPEESARNSDACGLEQPASKGLEERSGQPGNDGQEHEAAERTGELSRMEYPLSLQSTGERWPEAGRREPEDGTDESGAACGVYPASSKQQDELTGSSPDGMEYTTSNGRIERGTESGGRSASGGCGPDGMANADGTGQGSSAWGGRGGRGGEARNDTGGRSTTFWDGFDLVWCRDNTARRFECGTFPLAYGVPKGLGRSQPELSSLLRPAGSNRRGRLKGYGNAINPQLAAQFILAFMEAEGMA